MAINQRLNGTPGSSLAVILEQPVEPGHPRLYWNGSAWITLAAGSAPPRLPVVPDPDIPDGGLLFQIPTTLTAGWPDKWLVMHVIDAASASKNEVGEQRLLPMVAGDDGGNGIPSISIPLSGTTIGGVAATGIMKLYGAMLLPAP
jgi:hypothetical protein